MKAAVTGAGGFIGSRLVRRLIGAGHQVSVLTRRRDRDFPPGTTVVVGDLAAAGVTGEFLRDCDVLFHCAGELRDPALMQGLHVEGTRRLLATALDVARAHRRPLHWVQLSSVGVYGPVSGPAATARIVTEETPEAPFGPYESTKAASDALVRQAAESPWLSYTIVRPSNVFGAGMPNRSLRQLADLVTRGLFFYIGPRDAVAPYVHVDDVVRLLDTCSFDPRARGEIFNLSHDCLLQELVAGIALAQGVRPPRLRLPESLMRPMTLIANRLGVKLVTSGRLDALVARTRYPVDKAARVLSFHPHIPVPASVGEVLSPSSLPGAAG